MECVASELRLYASQWAWLSSRRPKERATRWEQYVAQGQHVAMPPLGDYAMTVMAVCQEIGLYLPGAYGPSRLTWAEIRAWTKATGARLTGWESHCVMAVSRAFVDTYVASDEHDVPSPWVPEHIDRDRVATQIGAILRGIQRRRR